MAGMPAWSPDDAMRAMDAVGTRLAVLSVTSPGVHLGDADSARRLARAVNEYGAEVVRRRPEPVTTSAFIEERLDATAVG